MDGININISGIKEGEVITVERESLDDYDMELIPQKIGGNLLLASYVYDFEIDGFKVITIKDITKIKRGEAERFHDFILEKEGLKTKAKMNLPIDSWYDFFLSIPQNEVIDISLEKEMYKENFFVGKIQEITENHLDFLTIDMKGKRSDCVQISYEDITLVSFQNRYSKLLQKYGDIT